MKKESKILVIIVSFYLVFSLFVWAYDSITGNTFLKIFLLIKRILILLFIIGLSYFFIKKNNWSYWIRGGITGLLIGILFLNIDSILTLYFEIHLFSYLSGFFGVYLYKIFFTDIKDPLKSIIFFVPTWIIYFLLGALVGLVIEMKIKKSNAHVFSRP